MSYLPIKVTISLISMSYDSKYREWVEKQTESEVIGKSDKIYQVYRGVPVFRVKIRDDPPQYRFVSPWGRAREYDRLCEKIDNRLDKTRDDRGKGKASRRDVEQDSESGYYLKWQDCQLELMDMKKREASLSSKLEEFQVKFDELNSVRMQLEKEVSDLRSLAADLNKQLEVARVDLSKKK